MHTDFLIYVTFYFFREIWNRFLEFECNIGDLASIVKVEKRRSAVLSKVCAMCLSILCFQNFQNHNWTLSVGELMVNDDPEGNKENQVGLPGGFFSVLFYAI